MSKILWFVGLALFLGAGCTEESNALRCLPGTTQTCVCVGGASGVQSCLASGTAVGPCECVDTDTPDAQDDDATSTDGHDTHDVDDTEVEVSPDEVGPDDTHEVDDTEVGPDDTHEVDDTEVGPDDVNAPDGLGDCPIARITIQEGDEVTPQTVLRLSGEGSSSTAGEIVAWEWSVVQPTGSVSRFLPSAFVANPTFEANMVGTYTFRLTVTDAQGNVSCVQAEYVVVAALDAAIRVELSWRTPGDPDETDTGGGAGWSAGTDLDLHFLHPRANGKYFDWTYDCNWDNSNPEWGFPGSSDNPSLARDDTDGAGPEILIFAIPEQNTRYQVGTHYWSDWGYGVSFATIRVYIWGVLRDQWADVRINDGDMWDSHYIDWPSGTVTRITAADGGPKIITNYPVSIF